MKTQCDVASKVARASEWWWFAEDSCALPSEDIISCAEIWIADQTAPAYAVLKAAGIATEVLEEIFGSGSGGWENGSCGLYDAEPWHRLANAAGKTIYVVEIQPSVEGAVRVLRVECRPGEVCVIHLD